MREHVQRLRVPGTEKSWKDIPFLQADRQIQGEFRRA